MKRSEKVAFVEDFQERLRETPVFYLTDFTGLDVQSMTGLRRSLKDSGAEFLVVKNRLLLRVLQALGEELPDLSEHLTGPTGVVFGTRGPIEAAKVLSDFAKENASRPAFKAGVVDGALVDAAHYQRLAKLPPVDQLFAVLAGAMEGKLREFMALVEALREERGSGEANGEPAGEESGGGDG